MRIIPETLCGNLSVPHNIVMDLNNVMCIWILYMLLINLNDHIAQNIRS